METQDILEKEKKKIEKRFYNPSKEDEDRGSFSHCTLKANINRFLPNVVEDSKRMYQDVLFNQSLSSIEIQNPNLFKELEVINYCDEYSVINENGNDQPRIYATFHFGSYKAISQYLVNKGQKLLLIIDNSVYKSQKKVFEDLANITIRNSINKNGDFKIFNVKNIDTIFKLKRLMNEGYSLVVYLDGNSGLSEKQDFSKGFSKIPFLKDQMYVKNGIQFIAKLTKALFIPVISHRESQNIILEFFESIDFSKTENKSVDAISYAYQLLEKKLLLYPEQWECWLYMHKWFPHDFNIPYIKTNRIENKFNKKRYDTFILNKTKFIFDLLNYRSFEIPNIIYEAIPNENWDLLPEAYKTELISKNIIV